jgi:hypothetical protein
MNGLAVFMTVMSVCKKKNRLAVTFLTLLDPFKSSGKYVHHLLQQPVTLLFVFTGFLFSA